MSRVDPRAFDGLSAADLIRELRELRAVVVDREGNPLVFIGCPCCGRGGWVIDIVTHAAACNSGTDLSTACSGACRAQLDVIAAAMEAESDAA